MNMAERTYPLLHFVLKLLSRIPFRMLYILSDGMFYLLYYIIRYRRKIVRKNLTESYPDKSLHETKHLEKAFYRFFMDMMLETCKLATISPDEIRRRMAFKNIEEVNATLRSGKSVAVYLGHYGNWEWVSSMPLWLEKGTIGAQIYHKLSNPNMDRLMLHIRERMGAVSVEMHKTARYCHGAGSRRQGMHHRLHSRPVAQEKGLAPLPALPQPLRAGSDRHGENHKALRI